MDEEKSRWSAFFTGIVLAIIFYVAFKRSIDLKTDFGIELLKVIGAIFVTIFTVVGFIVLTIITSGYAESGAKNIRAFYVLFREKKKWCEEVDAFIEQDRKDKHTTEDRLDSYKDHINTNYRNGDIHYKSIKEIREFIGIDAQKAQADAEKAIEESVNQ